MAAVTARIQVRVSLGEGVTGDIPAAVRKAAIDFEDVSPRKLRYDDSLTAEEVSELLAQACTLKVSNWSSPDILVDEWPAAKVAHVINPVNPEVWRTLGSGRGGVIYKANDANGTEVFIGFHVGE